MAALGLEGAASFLLLDWKQLTFILSERGPQVTSGLWARNQNCQPPTCTMTRETTFVIRDS